MFTDRFVSRCLIATAGAGSMAVAAPSLHAQLLYAGDVRLDGLTLRYHLMVWLFVIAMGVGYAVAARRPSAQRGRLVAGGLGKLAAAAVWTELLASGVGAPLMAAGSAWDGTLGTVFLLHAWRPRGSCAAERSAVYCAMGKADDMRRQREAQHAQQLRGAAPAAASALDADVEALIAEGAAAAEDAADPEAAEGKCAVCRKLKALHNGLVAPHQKGLGKMCPGSRKPPG